MLPLTRTADGWHVGKANDLIVVPHPVGATPTDVTSFVYGLWPAYADVLLPRMVVPGAAIRRLLWNGCRYKEFGLLLLTKQRFEKVDNLLPCCLWIACKGTIANFWVGAEIIGLA